MDVKKKQDDRGIGRIVIVAFAVALVLAIGYVVVTQSGIIPGDAPTQQGGVGPEATPAN